MQMKAKQAEKLEEEATAAADEFAALAEDIELPVNLHSVTTNNWTNQIKMNFNILQKIVLTIYTFNWNKIH